MGATARAAWTVEEAGASYGDPGLDAYTRQLQSMLQAQSAGQSADTKAAIQQALIAYGLVPQGFKDEFGALDPTTQALIQKNTDTGISGYARLLEGQKDAETSLINRLGAKGLAAPAAKGYLQRRGQLNFDRQSQDAISALLSNVGGLKRSFADAEQNRQMQMLQALFQARMNSSMMQNQQQRFAAGPLPNGGYTPPPASYSAPAYQNQQYLTGQTQPSGYAVPTGGGWYTNQQTGDLTSKWQKLAGM